LPQRAWLETHLGYASSGRAREKIRDWFRARDVAVNESEGRSNVIDLLGRLALPIPSDGAWLAAAAELGYDSAPALCSAVATGDCQILDAVRTLHIACTNTEQPRLVSVMGAGTYRIEVRADDRRGLLRDVTQVLSELRLSLAGNSGRVDAQTERAELTLDVRVDDMAELAIVVDRLGHLEGVLDARVRPR
jgi:(p)ppGpp synthase/HD superfamily hydrolase